MSKAVGLKDFVPTNGDNMGESNLSDGLADNNEKGDIMETEAAVGVSDNSNKENPVNNLTDVEVMELARERGLSVKEKVTLTPEVEEVPGGRIIFLPGVALFRVESDFTRERAKNLNGLVLGTSLTPRQAKAYVGSVIVEQNTPVGLVRLYGKVGIDKKDGRRIATLDQTSFNAMFNMETFRKYVGEAFERVYGKIEEMDWTVEEMPVRSVIRLTIRGKTVFEGPVFVAMGRDAKARIMARDIRVEQEDRQEAPQEVLPATQEHEEVSDAELNALLA